MKINLLGIGAGLAAAVGAAALFLLLLKRASADLIDRALDDVDEQDMK